MITPRHSKYHVLEMSMEAADPFTTESPKSYLDINRAAYDALADEYRDRRKLDREKDLLLIQPFIDLLREHFAGGPIHVLDLGCGNGLNLGMFADEGFQVTGIDISPRMLDVARDTCPTATLLAADFLAYPFDFRSFDGVFAKASIHLFPHADAVRLLQKVSDVLRLNGVFYVTTTVEQTSGEGLRKKSDYNHAVARYRRSWSEQELLDAVASAGFQIVKSGYNSEVSRGKRWFNVWASKL